MINKIIISIIILFLYGCTVGMMDHLQFHYEPGTFKNEQFWNPQESWKNKYKDGNVDLGPKFFGSTTFLVWTTDAWHLFQTIGLTILQLLIAYLALRKQKWYWILLAVGLAKLVFAAGFHLFYTLIF